jgi:hypothetical protein
MTSTAEAPVDALTRLTAIEDIKLLRARYWRFVDTKDWVAFAKLFAPDATFSDHGFDFHCAPGEVPGKISAALPDAIFSAHHGHQSEIVIEDAEHATGIWAMEDYLIFPPAMEHPSIAAPPQSFRGYGHYFDRYVKPDGQWLFQKVDLYRLRLELSSSSRTAYPTA